MMMMNEIMSSSKVPLRFLGRNTAPRLPARLLPPYKVDTYCRRLLQAVLKRFR
jgi:hypothetical protein